MTQACLSLNETSEIGDARRTTLRMADQAGFSETRRGEIAIVVTELATNLIRHAVDGQLFVQRLCSAGAEWFEMLAVDRGPGMTDVQRCLQDGYSTAGTPGNGLAPSAACPTNSMFSTEAKGTVVLSRFRLDTACARRRSSRWVRPANRHQTKRCAAISGASLRTATMWPSWSPMVWPRARRSRKPPRVRPRSSKAIRFSTMRPSISGCISDWPALAAPPWLAQSSTLVARRTRASATSGSLIGSA